MKRSVLGIAILLTAAAIGTSFIHMIAGKSAADRIYYSCQDNKGTTSIDCATPASGGCHTTLKLRTSDPKGGLIVSGNSTMAFVCPGLPLDTIFFDVHGTFLGRH
jgi:hypothetical protein